MSQLDSIQPVLILGAGINGCCVARELVLNGVPVVLVEEADIATGATAKSSRLIHGGLRYLEYGDFRLVAESLHERERLLRLAPQFVKPLKLHIPVTRRFGGLIQSAFRFLRLSRFSFGRWLSAYLPSRSERGLMVVRIGLWFYDWIARSSLLPSHTMERVGEAGTPTVDANKFHWLCSYYDAQMLSPERFVIALLEDARKHAAEQGIEFRIYTHHGALFEENGVVVRRVSDGDAVHTFQPSTIINATGAWGDLTLDDMDVETERLLGGTKGSHFITPHPGLRQALGDGGIYAEAADGRLVFILPFGQSVLVGTTDERFEGSPGDAVASEAELEYLIGMTNDVVSGCHLTRADIKIHYSGVRPLPYVPSGRTGSIPRGHWIHTTTRNGIVIDTLIGGKLTTCRAFGEEVANLVMGRLNVSRIRDTRDRMVPGAEEFPADVQQWCHEVASQTGYDPMQVHAVFELQGTRCSEILTSSNERQSLPGTTIPVSLVDWTIRNEWVGSLGDLVERRLGLVLHPWLTWETITVLADRMCHSGLITEEEREQEISDCLLSLKRNYGVEVSTSTTEESAS
ncbi:MAG: glycerol-3-phosphate dehydrogenase/oxidase [Planctomycetaceae bacterium]|nr:glycerol-3-phosphate dehydrogenase/oxidase [Planctomycetaceae bacterium]